MSDGGFVFGLARSIFEEIFFVVINFPKYLKPIHSCLCSPHILRWISIISKGILLLLVIKCLKYLQPLFLLANCNIDNSLKCLPLVFVLKHLILQIFEQLKVRDYAILPSVHLVVDLGVEVLWVHFQSLMPEFFCLLLLVLEKSGDGHFVEDVTHLSDVRLTHFVVSFVEELSVGLHKQLADACENAFSLGY